MSVAITRHPAGTGRGDDVWGRRTVHLFEITMDASALAAGEVLGLAGLGVKDPTHCFVSITQVAPANAGYAYAYDRTNDKLVTFWGNNDGVADSAFVATPDATDLSAVVVHMLVIEA